MNQSPFASGKFAKGICDRCGLTFKLHALKFQVVNRKRTGLLVCQSCLDQDHPQYLLGTVKPNDPQALRDPRPDRPDASRGVFGWNPVGAESTGEMVSAVGTVSVTI